MRKPQPKARQGIPTVKPARNRRSAEQMLVELRTHGSQRELLDQMHTRQQLYDLLRYAEYEQRDRQFHSTDDDHATS